MHKLHQLMQHPMAERCKCSWRWAAEQVDRWTDSWNTWPEEHSVLLFKWRIISGQQRTGQSARRIVINNQNPFKIVHAIWLELKPPDARPQGWMRVEQEAWRMEDGGGWWWLHSQRQHQRLVKWRGRGCGRPLAVQQLPLPLPLLCASGPFGRTAVYRWYDNWHEAIIHLDTFTLTIVYIAISVMPFSVLDCCSNGCCCCCCWVSIKYNFQPCSLSTSTTRTTTTY